MLFVCFNAMYMYYASTFHSFFRTVYSTVKKISDDYENSQQQFNHVELDWVFKLAYLPTILLSPLN